MVSVQCQRAKIKPLFCQEKEMQIVLKHPNDPEPVYDRIEVTKLGNRFVNGK